MTVTESIKKRRAIYPSQYKLGAVSEKDIKEILENANLAPTHRLTQPWFFKVYQNKSKLELADSMVNHYKLSGNLKNVSIKEKKIIDKCIQSSCIIVIFMKRDEAESIPEWEEVASTAMAVQNMWLTCVEKNIGCYWSTPSYIQNMGDYFKLKQNQKCLGFFYMGKFNHEEKMAPDRKNIFTRTEWFK
tara:strand:+ start:2184 stop:2747 length:564 start_codon:yes stop_codon:yes gene_type:complete